MTRRDSVRRWGVLLGLAAVVAALLPFITERHGFFDLKVYHGAVRFWLQGDGMLYDWLKPQSKYGFTYPPFAALVMAPMAFLPFNLVAFMNAAATVVVTVMVLWLLLDDLIVRRRWTPWYAIAIAGLLAAVLEPVRETFTFGQVNMLLLGLVVADVLLLCARGSRFAGVGIGLATAIKLTPGVFLLYLLVTKQWRAAAVAAGTAAGVTIGAGAIAPDATREFWTTALFDTDRVGNLAFVSNQSLQGMVARLHQADPSTALWAVLVLATVALWAVKVRRAYAAGDQKTPMALTGVLGCLISPVTWVHHLIWLLPALILVVVAGLDAAEGSRQRTWWLGLGGLAYLALTSRVVWRAQRHTGDLLGFVFANAYVWVGITLLIITPAGVSEGSTSVLRRWAYQTN